MQSDRSSSGAPEAAAAASAAFRWSAVLEERAAAERIKGQRTILRLKAATAAALETTPYAAFKISDVTTRAGVAYSLFYHYFPDKSKLAEVVLREFIAESDRAYRSIRAHGDARASVYAANFFYVELYRLNAGLMAAVFALAEEVESFRLFWTGVLHGWHVRIARTVAANSPQLGQDGALLTAYALGGMIDQLCLQLYVQHPPELGTYGSAEVAETLTRIWHRAVFDHGL